MRYHTLVKAFFARSVLALFVCLYWPAFLSAQERTVFTYTDTTKAQGSFAHVSGKDWVEFTGTGETHAFQEVARNADYVELFDPTRGGIGIRLFKNDSQWNHVKDTKDEWTALWPGSWSTSVDLRADFQRYGLTPRQQGKRDTCSVFTTVGAFEFGISKQLGKSTILSVEFLNWASNEVAGDKFDGSFFADCLDGFRKFGVCSDALMLHETNYDPQRKPSSRAIDEAAALRHQVIDSLRVHWIRPPVTKGHASDPGLTPRQFVELKVVLAHGFPVAFGSGHSILLVGYQDNETKAGGGEFLVKDSNQQDFASVSYEHVKTQPHDVYWIDFRSLPQHQRKLWAFRTGLFKHIREGYWMEFGYLGGHFSFKETARTPDYVELFDQNRQLTLRIYGECFGKLFYKTPDMRQWALMYDGQWID